MTTAEKTIRVAEIGDLPAIDDIYNQAIAGHFLTASHSPLTAQRRVEWFQAHEPSRCPVYVCETGGRVVGWLSVSDYRPGREGAQDVAELSYYVEQGSQGQGVGSALMEHALADVPRLGRRVVFAVVIDGNRSSLGLLEKFGFERWGFLPEVVTDKTGREVRGQVYMGKVLRRFG